MTPSQSLDARRSLEDAGMSSTKAEAVVSAISAWRAQMFTRDDARRMQRRIRMQLCITLGALAVLQITLQVLLARA